MCHRLSTVGSPRSGVRSSGDLAGSAASRPQLEPLRPQVWAGPSAAAEVNIFAGVPVPVAPGRSLGSGNGDTSISVPSCSHSSVLPRQGHYLMSLVALVVFVCFMYLH